MKSGTFDITLFGALILSILLHTGSVSAQSSSASSNGSEMLASGLVTASAGGASIAVGVATVPITIIDSLASSLQDSGEASRPSADQFPVADEIIILQPNSDEAL